MAVSKDKPTRAVGSLPKRKAYVRTAEHIAIARRNTFRLWAELPRCGAKAKSTGEPCKRFAMRNGRCALHGGKTPKGRDWHKVQLSNVARSVEKADKKSGEVAKRRRRQAERLAAMTEAERAAHVRWQKILRAGTPEDRVRAKQARWLKSLLAGAVGASSPATPDSAKPDQGDGCTPLCWQTTTEGIFG